MRKSSRTHAQDGVIYKVDIEREDDPEEVYLAWQIISIDGEDITEVCEARKEKLSEDS